MVVVRDSQRQKVYDWESAQGWFDGTRVMDKEDCIKLIQSAWRMWVDGVPAPDITFKDGRRRSCYYLSKHEIILNERDNRAEACLHEVSHAIMHARVKYMPFAPHGPEFVALYIMLLVTYLGYDGATLRQKAARGGVLVARNIPFDMVNPNMTASINMREREGKIAFAIAPRADVKMTEFRIGERIKFRSDVRPAYMADVSGTIKAYRQKKLLIQLDKPNGRFRNGSVVAYPTALTRA